MTDAIMIEAIGLVVALIAVVSPIVKLNVNIARLNATLQSMEANFKEKHEQHDLRITRHGEQIDELEKTVVNHDTRINALEKGKR